VLKCTQDSREISVIKIESLEGLNQNWEKRKEKMDLIRKCVRMIDPTTGWFEIHQNNDKRSITIANIAKQEWFSRYLWSTQITYDRGSEFIGTDFQSMIKNDYGIKGKPITVRSSSSQWEHHPNI
jgi:hypothetical protein